MILTPMVRQIVKRDILARQKDMIEKVAGGRPKAISTTTDGRMPAPGRSGLAWSREVRPIPVAGKIANKTTRTNAPTPAGANKPAFSPIIGDSPRVHLLGISEPSRTPTTADPPSRYVESPAARHDRLYVRPPDVGGSAPWQGINFTVGGRVGGLPTWPESVLFGVKTPLPGTIPSQGTVARGLRMEIGRARRELKRPVIMRPGLGGLDYAQSERSVPDTPSGNRETIRDVRKKSLYGSLIGHRTAPETVVAYAAKQRIALRASAVKATSTEPENATSPLDLSNPTPAFAANDATGYAGSAIKSSAPRTMVSTGAAVDSTQQSEPASTPGNSTSWMLPVLAVVAFLVITRS